MFYDRVAFDDGVIAWREINANGHVTRYCDDDGVNIGRLSERVNIVDGGVPPPSWAVADPVPDPVPTPAPVVRRVTKLAFVGRLGDDFAAILTAAKTDVQVELFVKMLDWATPDQDGTSVDLDDPRVVFALNTLEAGGLISAGRAAEVLSA